MKTARFSDAQIMGILRQAESGVLVCELCREHGMSSAHCYKWRSKYGGMAMIAVKTMAVSVALACCTFEISETCYRYVTAAQ